MSCTDAPYVDASQIKVIQRKAKKICGIECGDSRIPMVTTGSGLTTHGLYCRDRKTSGKRFAGLFTNDQGEPRYVVGTN